MYLFTMEANSTMGTWTLSDPPGSMRDVDLLTTEGQWHTPTQPHSPAPAYIGLYKFELQV